MNKRQIGTDGKRRRPLPTDELVRELRPHGRGFAWLRWLVFWRIGIGNIVAYVFIIAVFVLGQVQDGDRRAALRTQAVRSNAQQARTTAALRAQADRANAQAVSTRRALCSFTHDLEDRVRGGRDFLRQHPDGIPSIPAATIRQSLDGQVRTLRALRGLNCPT